MAQYIAPTLFLILINSLYIMGLYIAGAFEPGDEARDHENILGGVHRWLRSRVGIFWTKPLLGCPVCMASVHTSYIYVAVAIIASLPWYVAVVLYPAYVCVVSATVGVINRIING